MRPLASATSRLSHNIRCGTTGVGSGGGKVKSATTEAEIDIPDGAIDDSAIFKLDGFDLSALFPDDASIADLLGAFLGSSIKIDAPTDLVLSQEAHLSFPKPPAAPADAFYFVYRRLQGPNGTFAYETIDEASPDPVTGKVVTHSPPFSGFVNSITGYDVSGVDPTGGTSYTTLMYANAAMPGKAAMGVITGKVLRQVFDPGAATPHYEGVPNALVSGVDGGGQPLTASQTGASVAISQKDGTFTLFDKAYQGGTVRLNAAIDGENFSATAFESNPQDLNSPGLSKYSNIATANITLPAKTPAAPPAAIAISVYKTVGGALQKASVIVAGTPVAFGLKAENATVTTVTVQGSTLPVRADTSKATSEPQMADGFTPSTPGAYTVIASASPAVGPPMYVSATFRVIASGGSATGNLPNDPPAVVSGLTVPSSNATGVQPSVFPQVTFTEPVKHLPQHVVLQGGGSNIAVVLSGDGPDGPVDTITTDDQVVTSLTIQPIQPLLYNTTYTLTLSSGIVDLDVDVNGQAAPKPLTPFTTTFTTFGPAEIGQSAEDYSSPAIVVLGDRGYLAVPQANQTGLKVYDVSVPTAPAEVLPSEPVVAIGYPYDLVGEETSPLTGGRPVVALTTGPMGVPYRPSDVYLYDVATDQPQWIGAVTLGTSPDDGVVRRTVMKDGVLYAATAGIGKGIQVVDLNLAMSDYQTATANGTSSVDYYAMLSELGLEGQGFAQDAITNTIFVNTGSGDNSRLWDLAVGDLNVDSTLSRTVVATGAVALAIADPETADVLYNGRVLNPDGSSALVWGYSIGLAHIGSRDIAVIIGFNISAANLQLVTVDVTNPRVPYALGSVAFNANQFDTRARLLIRDDVVYVAGQSTTTLVSIADPLHPQVQGSISGFAGNLAFAGPSLLLSIGAPLSSSRSTGVQTAALGTVAVIQGVTPAVVETDDDGRTQRPVTVRYQVIGPSDVLSSASIILHRDNAEIGRYPAQLAAGVFEVTIPAGVVLDTPPERVSVTLVKPGGGETAPFLTSIRNPDPGLSFAQGSGSGSPLPFTALSPGSAPRGAASVTVVIGGSNLASLSQVFVRDVNGLLHTVDVGTRTAGQIAVTLGAELLTSEGFLQFAPSRDFDKLGLGFLVARADLPVAGTEASVTIASVFPDDLSIRSETLHVDGTGLTNGMAVVLGRKGKGGLVLETQFSEDDQSLEAVLPLSSVGLMSDLTMSVLSTDGQRLSSSVPLLSSSPEPLMDPAGEFPAGDTGLRGVDGEIVWNAGSELQLTVVGPTAGAQVRFVASRGTKINTATATPLSSQPVTPAQDGPGGPADIDGPSQAQPSPDASATLLRVPVPKLLTQYPFFTVTFEGVDRRGQTVAVSAPAELVPQEPFEIPFGGRAKFVAYHQKGTDAPPLIMGFPVRSEEQGGPRNPDLDPQHQLVTRPSPKDVGRLYEVAQDASITISDAAGQAPTAQIEREAGDPAAVYVRGVRLTDDPGTSYTDVNGPRTPGAPLTIRVSWNGLSGTARAKVVERHLGTNHPEHDWSTIVVANQYAIPPQYLKAQIEVETKFKDKNYRYEPMTIDFEFLTGDGTIKQTINHQLVQTIFKNGQTRRIETFPYDAYAIQTDLLPGADSAPTEYFSFPGFLNEGLKQFVLPRGVLTTKGLPRPGVALPIAVDINGQTLTQVRDFATWTRAGSRPAQPLGVNNFAIDAIAKTLRLGRALTADDTLSVSLNVLTIERSVGDGPNTHADWDDTNPNGELGAGVGGFHMLYQRGETIASWLDRNIQARSAGLWLVPAAGESRIEFNDSVSPRRSIEPRLAAVTAQFYAAASYGPIQMTLGEFDKVDRRATLINVLDIRSAMSPLYQINRKALWWQGVALGAAVHQANVQLITGSPTVACIPCSADSWETLWSEVIEAYNPKGPQYQRRGDQKNNVVGTGRKYEPY